MTALEKPLDVMTFENLQEIGFKAIGKNTSYLTFSKIKNDKVLWAITARINDQPYTIPAYYLFSAQIKVSEKPVKFDSPSLPRCEYLEIKPLVDNLGNFIKYLNTISSLF